MTFLLDVNVLIALAWPDHASHTQARLWFSRSGSRAWATCPFTEAVFVRILSNPAFSEQAVSPVEALYALKASTGRSGHHFWQDEIGFADAVAPFESRLKGHQQVSDVYLLGLALHKNGRLATLDRGIIALLPGRRYERLVEIVE